MEEKPLERYVAETPVGSQKMLARVITVETPLYSVAINENGAVFQSYVLKEYKESIDPDAAYKELIDPTVQPGHAGAVSGRKECSRPGGGHFLRSGGA